MDFALSHEQELIRESAREFCEREVVPHAREWDREEEIERDHPSDFFADQHRERQLQVRLLEGPVVLDSLERRRAAVGLRAQGQIDVKLADGRLIATLTGAGRERVVAQGGSCES